MLFYRCLTLLSLGPLLILNGPYEEWVSYEGMSIGYSGYNGDGTNLGNEYITISGTLGSDLTMKAFGYASGNAQVDYSWGNTSL